MKTKHQLTLIVLFFVLLSSCKKSDNGNGAPTPKKSKYLTEVIAVNGSTTTFTKYTYDSEKRLIGVSNPTDNFTYSYTTDGLKTIADNLSNGTKHYLEFSYQDGKVKSCHFTHTTSTGTTNTLDYYFVYSGDKISEMHHDVYVDLYTYDSNNNIAKIVYDSYARTFSYDNKPNKLLNAPAKFTLFLDVDDRFSPNNVVQTSGAGPGVTTITYNYDSDGFPTGAVSVNSVASYLNTKYSYTYTEM